MSDPSNEVLDNVRHIDVPKMTTTVRNTLAAPKGTIIYDTTQNKLCFKNDVAVAATSWELITSIEES